MNPRSVEFLVVVLIAGFRPADDCAAADATAASPSTAATSPEVTGRHSSCGDLGNAAAGRCKTTAAYSTTCSGDSGFGDCDGGVQAQPSSLGHDDQYSLPLPSPPPPLIVDRPRRLLIDRRRWRRHRWPRANDGTTAAAAGYRRRVIDRQRPRTKLKTVEKMILYGMSMFFEKLELAVYLSLYKIKLLYTTLIAPLLS